MKSRSDIHPAFYVALALTIAVAFLPQRWRLGWSTEVARIAQIPIRPFTHLGNSIAGWVRPAADPAASIPPEFRDDYDRLILDRETALRDVQKARGEAKRLEDMLAELQRLPVDLLDRGQVECIAPVTRRSVGDEGIVEVALPRDAGADVSRDAVAVYRSVHLVGRVTGDPSPSSTLILPMTLYDKVMTALIVADADDPGVSIALRSDEQGKFIGEVPSDAGVTVGSTVRLNDERWPAPARFLTLGTVESVTPREQEPLASTVTVTPGWNLDELTRVTLISPRELEP